MNIFLGNNSSDEAVFFDIQKMPHVLIAGFSEKEVSGFNAFLLSTLLIENSAEKLKIILMDSDRSELSIFDEIPHLQAPIIHHLKKAVNMMDQVMSETDRRLKLIEKAYAVDIHSFNIITAQSLPHIVVMLHDLADLMITHAQKTETFIHWMTNKAHLAGIHLIISTCRPSVYVITGRIKSRIRTRIAFQVPSEAESKIILDQPGAENLNGKSDMLYFAPDAFQANQIQGIQFSQKDIAHIVNEAKKTHRDFQVPE